MRQITPAKKLTARTVSILRADGDDFVSQPIGQLEVDFDGINGDFHAGATRASGSREPWYKRGTKMRNERQLSIVSTEELAEIAAALKIDRLEAGWVGANLVLEGIEALSFLPPRSLLMFAGGVTLRVDGYNAPCRLAGGSIARHCGIEPVDDDYTRTDMALTFKDAAEMKRGLVAWVEKPGTITLGEEITIRLWPQWIY